MTKEYKTHYSSRRSTKFNIDEIPDNYYLRDSDDLLIYNTIYSVFNERMELEDAIIYITKKFKLKEDYLKNLLIDKRLIKIKSGKDSFDEIIKSYNTKKLKKILKKNNLKASGNRRKIIKRIKNNLEDVFLKEKYYLTKTANWYYKNIKRRMELYYEYFEQYYYFRDFNYYYKKHYRKYKRNIANEFSDINYNISLKRKDHYGCLNAYYIKCINYLKNKEYLNGLKEMLKCYIFSINPIFLDKVYYNEYEVFSLDLEIIIFNISKYYSYDIILKEFYKIWNSFEFEKIIVPKDYAYICLKDLLKRRLSCQELNKKISDNYYKNDNLKVKIIKQSSLEDYF